MTLDPVHPKEYKFDYEGVLHIGSGCNEWICPAGDLDQVLRDIEIHEKKCHQAKVIQMHGDRLQKIHPL